MDSFFDQPRSAPVPASIDQIPSSLVPEVSIILPSNSDFTKQREPLPIQNKASYSVWKTKSRNAMDTKTKVKYDKENISHNEVECNHSNASKTSSRKHVRFNNPHVQSNILKPNNICNNASNYHFTSSNPNKQDYINYSSENANNTFNKPFEQIYMANIPSRHLDLSIIEPSTYKNHEAITENVLQKKHDTSFNCTPQATAWNNNQTYENNKDSSNSLINVYKYNRKYNSINSEKKVEARSNTTDQLQRKNYKVHEDTPLYNYTSYELPLCSQSETYKSSSIKNQNNTNESTVRDLLKVVQQQNEQILLLQKQVAILLQNQSNQKPIEAPTTKQGTISSDEHITSTKNEHLQCGQENSSKGTGTVSKIAIDVMTSFEVSIRPPCNYSYTRFSNEYNAVPKIQEIIETEANGPNKNKITSDNLLCDMKQPLKKSDITHNADISLTLDEPLQVVERCLSPENSIHVDMKDYSSDSSDESTGSSTEIGWTIYNNVMGQVNNILKKANQDMKELNHHAHSSMVGEKTLKKVKEATMRHLKNIGVNLPLIEEPNISQRSNDTMNNSVYTPTEISFAVKQLLMKYLPDEQLAKITQSNPINPHNKNIDKNIENLIKKRPEFSFATIQYMKKYNLFTSDSMQEPLHMDKNNKMPKILDVTALKQQPKLL